jgi:hypothetical protein
VLRNECAFDYKNSSNAEKCCNYGMKNAINAHLIPKMHKKAKKCRKMQKIQKNSVKCTQFQKNSNLTAS